MTDKPEEQLATVSDTNTSMARPSRLKAGDRRGLEDMTRSDVLIPRLSLAQALSPEVTVGDPALIPGLKVGDLFNSMTKQVYGREVYVQIIRKDRLRAMQFNRVEDGGGVLDPNVPIGDPRLKWVDGNKPVATLFRDYIAVILPTREIIALSFKSSGLKVAMTLNGLMGARMAPMWEGRYKITTGTALKPKPHQIYKVDNAGWVSDEDSALGEQMFEAVKSMDIDRDPEIDDVDDAFPHVPSEGDTVDAGSSEM